jgi:hypothetical protein
VARRRPRQNRQPPSHEQNRRAAAVGLHQQWRKAPSGLRTPLTSLHFLYYNFVRIHKTLKVTPAMAAGVTDHLWEVADMVGVLEAWEAAN